MKSFYDEDVLLEFTFSAHPRIFVFGNYFKGKKVFRCIFNKNQAKQWTNSSGKGDSPPDFYNTKKHMMLEVMRVDDHTHKNKKGKLVNPLMANERRIFNEINAQFKDIPADTANKSFAFINAPTGLPTNDDHRFSWYKSNFKRVVEDHSKKIALYKSNHPGYSTVFFVFDESSAYVQPKNLCEVNRSHCVGEGMDAYLHFWYKDIDFVKVIKNTGADYFIWYAPYKYIDVGCGKYLPLSCIAVYDIKNLSINDKRFEKYNASYLISVEI